MSTAPTSPAAEPASTRHEQFWGNSHLLTREQQRAVYVTGHMAAGFLNLLVAAPLGAYVDIVSSEPEGGGAEPTSPTSKALGVTETLVRGITTVTEFFDDPIPLGNPTVAYVRRFGELAGVLTKAGFTYGTWSTSTPVREKGEAVVDLVAAVLALVPTVWSIVELADEDASPDKTLAVLDEVANLCESAAAYEHLGATMDPEDISKTAISAAELGLVGASGLLHLGQGWIALEKDPDDGEG